MKISYNWLKQYIDLDINPNELSVILTDIGLEVEGMEEYESIKGGMKGLIIGEVLTCEQHPNADRLSVTTVNIGTGETLPIVCGAPNVAVGQKVVIASVGTMLYMGKDEVKIKKGKIRGEQSLGMICAQDEIGIGTDHDGIIVLPETVTVGMPASDYFSIEKDIVFEIGLTPNRIDGASHHGAARDLAAFLKLHKPEIWTGWKRESVDSFKVDNQSRTIGIEIENTAACHRYAGLTISGIEVKESPEWIQNKLKAIGLSPINNIVDITNFVLHEVGQPLHAFDANQIVGNKVIVKTLSEGSEFVTLDEQTRKLSSEDLMICNSEGGMCIAGVFGGLKSGVNAQTTSIFLESAYFNPVYVRKTSKRHMLQTDASFRFERGTDPNIVPYALKRAALLIKEIAGGEISSEIIDIYPEPVSDFRVEISYKRVNSLIGKEIEKETIQQILESLDIKIVEQKAEGLTLNVPPYRVDVQREADVVEEILRIYGYNNIEISEKVNSTLSYIQKPDSNQLRNTISELLSANGFNEAMSNSLTKKDYYNDLKEFKAENTVEIFNPLSIDLNAMRQTLLFNGLEAIIHNINHKNLNLRLYEFGNCYSFTNKETENPIHKYNESQHLAVFLSGKKEAANWSNADENVSFYQLKASVEKVLKRLNYSIEKLTEKETDTESLAYGMEYVYNNKPLVTFGSVSKLFLNKFDIAQEVFYADFNWDIILQKMPEAALYQEIPKYPKVKRDLALLVDKSVKFNQIKAIAYKAERKLLKNVSIFDVYEGENLANDKKSYAVSFTLQDEHKTLKDKQIDKIMQNLIKNFMSQLDAQIR